MDFENSQNEIIGAEILMDKLEFNLHPKVEVIQIKRLDCILFVFLMLEILVTL